MSAMRETMWRQPDDLRRVLGDPRPGGARRRAHRGPAGPARAAPARAGTRPTTAPRCCASRASRRGRCRPTSRRSTARGPRPGTRCSCSATAARRPTRARCSNARRRPGPRRSRSPRSAPPAPTSRRPRPRRARAFTSSHLCAILRVAQIARALGADLDLDAVPDAVAAELADDDARRPAARAAAAVRRQRHQCLDRRRGRAQDPRDRVRRRRRLLDGVPAARPERRGRHRRRARRARRRRRGVGAARESSPTRSPATVRVVHRFRRDALGEPLSVFALTTIVQRIALEAAERLGTNPDSFGKDLPGRGEIWAAIPL